MRLLRQLLERLRRDEAGMALVLALGMMTVLGISVVTVVDYASSSSRNASYSRVRMTAFDLADAGMNNALAVLNLPSNNALDPDTLPSCSLAQSSWKHSTYGSGTVDWCGTLDRTTAIWSLTSIGAIKNPTGPKAGNVTRKLTAKVPVTPTLTQPLNNPVWNYLYAGHTGSTCDQTLNNNITGASRMYVAGNLCLSPNVALAQSTVIVGGNLDVSNNAAVGASTNMSTRVETYVGGNCRYATGSWVACSGNQDARNIFSKLSDGSTIAVNHTPPVVPAPAADFATWYENGIPGPSQSCTTSSGTVPTFDTNYPSRDNSVSTVFDLTPTTSYTCRVGPSGSPSGELSWNATTKTLTVSGTIFIDGSAKVSNSAVNQYNGQATIYLSGTLLLNGTLCGGITGSVCDVSAWNPNTEMLSFVANGNGGQVNTGDSIMMNNNFSYQGALYGTNAVELGNNCSIDGPIVGSEIKLGNNLATNSFPSITTVPVGMPSNPAVYAQPNPPQSFSG